MVVSYPNGEKSLSQIAFKKLRRCSNKLAQCSLKAFRIDL